jgi:hypothetical protein
MMGTRRLTAPAMARPSVGLHEVESVSRCKPEGWCQLVEATDEAAVDI